MEFIVAIFIVGLVMAATIAIERNQLNKLHDSWGSVANALGLEFDPSNNILAGKTDGVDIYVHIVVRGSGKSKRVYTVFSSAAADILPVGLAMMRQHLLMDVGKFFGMQDIEVGDPGFDDRFVIKCQFEEDTREFFSNATIRDALLELADTRESLKVADGAIVFESNGRITDKGQIRSGIRDLVACVGKMRRALDAELESPREVGKLPDEFAQASSPAPETHALERMPEPEPEPLEEEDLEQKWAVPEDSEEDDVLW